MAEHGEWIFSGTVSASGLLCVASYAWAVTRPGVKIPAWWDRLDTLEGVLRRRRRRHLGMAIVALLSVSFFPGTRSLNPDTAPIGYLTYWLLMSLLVMWLCLLALSDVWHTRRLRARLLRKSKDGLVIRSWSKKTGG